MIDISKWIFVQPDQGVILGGNSVDIGFTIHVKEGALDTDNVPPLLLAIRTDDSRFDQFFCLSCEIRPSLYGLSLWQLQNIKFSVIRPREDVPPLLLPNEEPDTIIRSKKDGRVKDVRKSEVSRASDDSASIEERLQAWMKMYPTLAKPLPLPKEIWWLLCYIKDRAISVDSDFSFSRYLSSRSSVADDSSLLRYTHTLLEALETGIEISEDVSSEAALTVLSQWGMKLPAPLVPRDFLASTAGDDTHSLCRAIILSLPMISRNIFLTIISLMRDLISKDTEGIQCDPQLFLEPMEVAAAEWTARFMLRDTPSKEGRDFVLHFLRC
eukprot:GHVO01052688.1.p1 GENE.GHVO01052688.1~~GHVO01052688.1.p1  ORF type:complete len:326 (-),score=49.50 GHVO01052688.1:57-1034(-)